MRSNLITSCVSKSLVDKTIIPLVLPARRRGAGLFLVQVLLLLFPERILPESEMLWESLWEPPVPRPEWTNKRHQKPGRTRIQSQTPWKSCVSAVHIWTKVPLVLYTCTYRQTNNTEDSTYLKTQSFLINYPFRSFSFFQFQTRYQIIHDAFKDLVLSGI